MSSLCAVHASSAATFTCERCGNFACAQCRSPKAQLCAGCFTRTAERLGASRRAKQSLWLAIIAFHGLFPLALVSLWLATQERSAIEAHSAPRGGEPWLQGARWLSMAALIGWSLVTFVMLRARLD